MWMFKTSKCIFATVQASRCLPNQSINLPGVWPRLQKVPEEQQSGVSAPSCGQSGNYTYWRPSPVPQHVCEMLLVTPVSSSESQSKTVPPPSPCTCFRLVSLPYFKEKINFLEPRRGETWKQLEGVTAPKLLLTQQLHPVQVPRSGNTA